MRKSLASVTAIALALSVGSAAFAADLPSYKSPPPPPPPPPAPLWTGFYVGVNAGGTFSDTNTVRTYAGPIQSCPILGFPCGASPFFGGGIGYPLASALASAAGATGVLGANTSGFIGGGQIGYNYQFGGRFVAGLEADIQGVAGAYGSATSGSLAPIAGPTIPVFPFAPVNLFTATQVTRNIDYIGTVRARAGFLLTPTMLVYATGGLAYGGVSTTANIFQAYSPRPILGATLGSGWGDNSRYSDTRVGWTVGAGGEWMFMPNWSAKLEYLYYDLGSVRTASGILASPHLTFLPGIPNQFTNVTYSTSRFNGHIVRAGINYHFWSAPPAPVYAKY